MSNRYLMGIATRNLVSWGTGIRPLPSGALDEVSLLNGLRDIFEARE